MNDAIKRDVQNRNIMTELARVKEQVQTVQAQVINERARRINRDKKLGDVTAKPWRPLVKEVNSTSFSPFRRTR